MQNVDFLVSNISFISVQSGDFLVSDISFISVQNGDFLVSDISFFAVSSVPKHLAYLNRLYHLTERGQVFEKE